MRHDDPEIMSISQVHVLSLSSAIGLKLFHLRYRRGLRSWCLSSLTLLTAHQNQGEHRRALRTFVLLLHGLLEFLGCACDAPHAHLSLPSPADDALAVGSGRQRRDAHRVRVVDLVHQLALLRRERPDFAIVPACASAIQRKLMATPSHTRRCRGGWETGARGGRRRRGRGPGERGEDWVSADKTPSQYVPK